MRIEDGEQSVVDWVSDVSSVSTCSFKVRAGSSVWFDILRRSLVSEMPSATSEIKTMKASMSSQVLWGTLFVDCKST